MVFRLRLKDTVAIATGVVSVLGEASASRLAAAKFAVKSLSKALAPRHDLDGATLASLTMPLMRRLVWRAARRAS
jgi:hypothetical protein